MSTLPIPPSSVRNAPAPLAGSAAVATFALAAPVLLAYNLPPSSTFLNQACALVGWGGWLVMLAGSSVASTRAGGRGLVALLVALALLLLAALASPGWTDLPWSLSLSAAGMVLAAALAATTGASMASGGRGRDAFRAFCIGMLVAGTLSCLVGIVQVFAPGLPDGNLIARTYIDGRAVGNMRQPNHLSSLLLWSIVAAVWLGEAGVLKRWATTALTTLFIFVVVLTASRTGALSMLLLLAWALVDKRLSRHARWLLGSAVVVYFVFWYATGVWADYSHHVFGGETRFSTKGDISSSRWGIWSNTLTLIRMHPWIGVGFGEFNFAWTLTPFPGRPIAFFDHTHNLVLQFLVELGIPLGLLVLALLGHALLQAWRAARRPIEPDAAPGAGLVQPCALAMVVLILLHSLLEYPLWYAYFLLPAAFAFGLCLGRPPTAPAAAPAADAAPRLRPLVFAGLALLLGGALSLYDYAKVVVIFAPSESDTRSLGARIVDGRRSIFFAHHANYAAATTSDRPADVMPAFLSAPHYLLDARLLQAWAKALDEAGDTEHARYLAQRLREFHNAQSAEFFAECDLPDPAKPLPFQCTPPSRSFDYEDFR